MRILRVILILLLLSIIPAPCVAAKDTPAAEPVQSVGTPPIETPQIGRPPQEEKTAEEKRMEQQMEIDRRKQRWKDIKRDSEKLLETATELKQYVDKAGENVMSLEVMKKAAEMEKLSHDLQKKMKGD